jgi:CP family cyanate transporter-like MFS transporter
VIEQIRDDTGMSSAVAGILTTIPFLCMGAFAFFGPPLVERLGSRRVILLSLVLIAGGSVGRALVDSGGLLIALTLPIGLGIALIGATLPVVVKEHFPDRPGAVTGAYVASLSVGIAMVGFGLVPLANALGGWREAFALSAVPALAALGFWIAIGRGPRPAVIGEAARRVRQPIRWARPSRAALLLGLVFGLQSMCFAGMVSWAPAVYEEAGWSQTTAAFTTSSIGIFTIVSSLTIPALSDGRDRRLWIVSVALVMGLGVIGVGLLTTTGAWVWLTMFGLGTGAVFSLLLSLPLDLTDDPAEVADLSAWMLGLGYLLSGVAPILVGALRDATGDFAVPFTLLGVFGIGSGLLALLTPRRQA